jgi:hypothetical protein
MKFFTIAEDNASATYSTVLNGDEAFILAIGNNPYEIALVGEAPKIRILNQEVATEWFRRLHSGDYRQAKGYLHTQTGEMCCLGLLCDIIEPAWKKWIPQFLDFEPLVSDPDVFSWAGGDDDDTRTMIPAEEWYSIFDDDENALQVRDWLAGLNDAGVTFEEIAQIMEVLTNTKEAVAFGYETALEAWKAA